MDYLKEISILYVDPEPEALLLKELHSKFKYIKILDSGEKAIEEYKNKFFENNSYDLIISALNLKDIDGIEMYEEIRTIHQESKCLFTSIKTDTEYLLKAIELNVEGFLLKPLNTSEVLEKIDNILIQSYFQKQLSNQKKERVKYIKALDNISVVFKMDKDGKLLDKNPLFKIKFDNKNSFSEIIHPDISEEQQSLVWETLNKGEPWFGTTKFKDKYNNPIYLLISIFKSDNEYITIGFDNSEEQKAKRDFHKNIILKIKEGNLNSFEQKKVILEMKSENERLKKINFSLKENEQKLLSKKAVLVKQINQYEKQMENVDKYRAKVLEQKSSEGKELSVENKKLESLKNQLIKQIRFLEEDLEKKEEKLKEADENRIKDAKTIFDLHEVIESMEEKMKQNE